MKLIILLIILCAFLQTTFIPLNLVLLFIIARSFAITDNANFILSFIAGILVGLLSSQNIGIYPIIFLSVTQIIYWFKKLPFSTNILFIIPLFILICTSLAYIEQIIFNQSFNVFKIIPETLIGTLVFIFVKFWEDRFIVKPQLRLRMK